MSLGRTLDIFKNVNLRGEIGRMFEKKVDMTQLKEILQRISERAA